MRWVLLCVSLCGCTLNIVDRRIDPAELNKAIATLSKNQDAIVEAVNSIQKQLPQKVVK